VELGGFDLVYLCLINPGLARYLMKIIMIIQCFVILIQLFIVNTLINQNKKYYNNTKKILEIIPSLDLTPDREREILKQLYEMFY
jgi:hypothetical protein